MFKVGDKVKFKKSSINTGMSDATESDVFEVSESDHAHIQLRDVIHSLTGWWNVNHFEHAEESVMDNTDDAMNNSEEKEINWEIGQEVFCILRGKGVVTEVLSCTDYPVEVKFADTFDRYTLGGKIYTDHKGRVLFFSEPKIEAEKFPPKKLFVPILKKGDTIFIKDRQGLFGEGVLRTVFSEIEDRIYVSEEHHYFMKYDLESVKIVGEEIKFS